MKLKRTIIAGAAAAGIAGIAFGGSAVATSFNSTSPTNYAEAQGATTGVSVDNGTFDAKDLVPGAAATSEGTVTIHNNGSVDAVATITFGHFTIKHNGTTAAPDPSELEFTINGTVFTAAFLDGQVLPLGTVASGGTANYTVSVDLKAGTGNEWNGADAYLPYTATMTAGS